MPPLSNQFNSIINGSTFFVVIFFPVRTVRITYKPDWRVGNGRPKKADISTKIKPDKVFMTRQYSLKDKWWMEMNIQYME